MITLIIEILLFIFAIAYIAISWTRKDTDEARHNSIISDIYLVGFFVVVGLSHQSGKVSNEVQVIHDTIITHAPTADEVIPAHNPHWNIPETTLKK